MGENWYTGIFYKVKSTKRIGEQIECPCDDPIILDFAPGALNSRRVYWLKKVEPASMPENWEVMKAERLAGKIVDVPKIRHKGVRFVTIQKFLSIYNYLKRQDEPVTVKEIQKGVGFYPYYFLGNLSHHLEFSLETLGIVERVPLTRNWLAWQLTEKGLREGTEIIESQYEEDL